MAIEQLAQALRTEMERRGHSYRAAATAMGVSTGSLVNWSKGWIETSPRQQHMAALAGYLEVPTYEILGWLGWLTPADVEVLRAHGVAAS